MKNQVPFLELNLPDFFMSSILCSSSLFLREVGRQKCLPRWSYGPNTSKYYMIHYVKSGKGIFQYQKDEIQSLKAGDAFLIPPDTVTFHEADEEEPWEYYWVAFDGTSVKDILSNTIFKDKFVVSSPTDLSVQVENILAHKGDLPVNQAYMIGYLYLFFANLMSESETGLRKEYKRDYFTKAYSYLSKNYSNEIHVENLCSHVGLSRSHLHRIFMEITGMPPKRFIVNYRVDQSINLLKSTELSINEIAASVGFNDPLHFSRVFSKLIGMSPRAFRKSWKLDSKDIKLDFSQAFPKDIT